MATSGGRRKNTLTSRNRFADPMWDASLSPSCHEQTQSRLSGCVEKKNAQKLSGLKNRKESENGDAHINATLKSLREAVRNGLLNEAFEEENETEAVVIACHAGDDFDHEFDTIRISREIWESLKKGAPTNSQLGRKLVRNIFPQ